MKSLDLPLKLKAEKASRFMEIDHLFQTFYARHFPNWPFDWNPSSNEKVYQEFKELQSKHSDEYNTLRIELGFIDNPKSEIYKLAGLHNSNNNL